MYEYMLVYKDTLSLVDPGLESPETCTVLVALFKKIFKK